MCLIFFCITAAKAQCDHTFRMIDSYGDGWNGATVDVVVGGVTVLNDVSPADAGYSGTQSIDNLTFEADDGDAILLGDWESGSYDYEISWEVLDGNGSVIKSGNHGETAVGDAVCPGPNISSFSPSNPCLNGSVTITGTGLSTPISVTVGGTPVPVTSHSSSEIIFTVDDLFISGEIEVTTAQGNANSSPSTITAVNDIPVATASSPTPTVCAGVTISLTGGVSGGSVGPFTYSWSGPNSFSSSTQSPIVNASATTAMGGSYELTVTDDNTSCSSTAATTVITVNSLPTASASTSTSTVCSGETISLTGAASGGSSTYTTYAWTGPDSYSASNTQNPQVTTDATTAMGGSYDLTVTDDNGCSSASSSTPVTVNSLPSVEAGNNVAYTPGGTIAFDATVTGNLTNSGVTIYSEDFSNDDGKGWSSSSYTAPTDDNWSLTKVGSPDVTGGGDHCKVVSQKLEWKDIAGSSSNRVDWYSAGKWLCQLCSY